MTIGLGRARSTFVPCSWVLTAAPRLEGSLLVARAHIGHVRPRRLRARARHDELLGRLRRERRRRIDCDDPRRPRPGRDADRHRGRVRGRRQRVAGREGAGGPARRRGALDEVRARQPCGRHGRRRFARARPRVARRQLAAPRHRSRRSLVPASRRPRHADRGDRRRDGRGRPRGQGAPPWALGAGGCDASPGLRRAPDRGRAVGVLAVLPRARGLRARDLPRARSASSPTARSAAAG